MRADDAKRLPLDRILAQLGFSPVKSKKNGRELWYSSPFRHEKDASLHISSVVHPRLGTIWIWKDFGDVGGNVIDFALRYYGLPANDVSGALARLDGLGMGGTRVQAPSPALLCKSAEPEQETSSYPFTEIQIEPLESRRLITYLAGRGIDGGLAKRYVQQVRYTYDGERYLALAFPNDEGGYEVHSTGHFKSVLPPKTITCLHLEKLAGSPAVTVFEGWTDYLSALMLYGRQEASTPVVILNSIVTGDIAVEKIRSLGVSKVHLYLDRDMGGDKMLAQFRDALPDTQMIDHSALYDGYKDFNEFLVAQKQERSR